MTQIDNTQDSDRSSLTASQASGEPLPVTAKKHQHGKETSSHDNSSNLSPEELDSLEEEIVNAALLGCSERHRTLPKCFDNKGRLYKPWAYLKGRTEESKQRYKTQSLATTKRLVPTKRSPKTTTRDNLHPQPQSFNEAVRPPLPTKHQPKTEDGQAVCEKCLTASVELNLVSDGGLMKAICSSCLQADQACSSPLQKKAHQSIKKVETKRDSHRAGQAQSSSIEKLKHSRKESTGTRRNLRSSPADVQDEGSQTMAGSAIAPVPQQPNPEAIVETQRDHAPSPSPPKIQVLVPYRAETAHIGFAAQIAHDDIQGGVLRPTVTCRICPEGHCSCNIAQGDYQGLRCNDSTCGKGWFSGNYLEEHCGIQLSDAHDARKIYGNWFCPECAYKARRMRNHIGALEPAQFSKIPESGKGMFDDNEVQQPLKRLSGLILQYISTAQTKPLQPSARTSFLEIPCIRDETYATSVEGSKPLLRSLRFILDVHPGALVKERILSLHLQDQKLSVWICGVIVSLFWEFVFQAGSPFEDAAIWREGLIHGKSSHSSNKPC